MYILIDSEENVCRVNSSMTQSNGGLKGLLESIICIHVQTRKSHRALIEVLFDPRTRKL